MKNLITYVAVLVLSSLSAFAMVTIKDAENIDQNDIAIKDFEQTDMAPAGLLQHKTPDRYAWPESDDYSASHGGIISVNFSNPNDLNWDAVQGTADSGSLRPASVTIPFLDSYPIQNIEIKFRLLNEKF
jgi:hypothetical protein